MKDKDLFSRFLPYAIALDVVDNWARAFEGIYQESPQWFRSQEGFGTFRGQMGDKWGHIPYLSLSFPLTLPVWAAITLPNMGCVPAICPSGGGSGFGGGGGGSW